MKQLYKVALLLTVALCIGATGYAQEKEKEAFKEKMEKETGINFDNNDDNQEKGRDQIKQADPSKIKHDLKPVEATEAKEEAEEVEEVVMPSLQEPKERESSKKYQSGAGGRGSSNISIDDEGLQNEEDNKGKEKKPK